jgi:hypothetical protein
LIVAAVAGALQILLESSYTRRGQKQTASGRNHWRELSLHCFLVYGLSISLNTGKISKFKSSPVNIHPSLLVLVLTEWRAACACWRRNEKASPIHHIISTNVTSTRCTKLLAAHDLDLDMQNASEIEVDQIIITDGISWHLHFSLLWQL